jgi:heat shock protein HslJ
MTRLFVATLVLGALLVGCAPSGSGSSLTGNTWEWTASTTTTPASQSVVPVPQSYTIEFKSNQTFEGKADCNQISGTWASTSGDGLAITLGTSTAAACGPDSLDSTYIEGLGKTSMYVLEEDKLILTQGAEGTMTFQ